MENGYKENDLKKAVNEIKEKSNADTLQNAETQSEDPTNKTPIITLPWIPGISPKLKKVYKKAGYKTVFKANANLQTILTSKNKVRLAKNSHPGVYKIQCKCRNLPPYIGETKAKVSTRFKQHEAYVRNGHWEKSGAAKHQKTCKAGFETIETIKIEERYFDRCIREALEIQRNGSGPKEGGVNLDYGKYVTTKFWLPLMKYFDKEEEKKQLKWRRRTSNNDVNITSM